jgi:CBS domain-containing protein
VQKEDVMKVESLMTKNFASCCPEQSLSDAARVMWERDCGIVPVIAGESDSRLLGVITDRDITMAAYTKGRALTEIGIGDVMSKAVVSCCPSDSLSDAERVMRRAQVHRLPVLDEAGGLLGVLSLADIARATRRGTGKQKLDASEVGETLAAISSPRNLEVGHAA